MSEFTKLQNDMMGNDPEPVEQPPVEAKPEPEPEPTPEPAPEPEPTVDPYVQAFKEEGLDRQFKDPIEVIRKQRDTNRYITALEQQNAEYRRQTQAPKPEPQTPVTGEELYNDPNTAFDRLGVVKREELETTQQRIERIERQQLHDEAVNALASQEELKDVADAWKRGDIQYSGNKVFNRMNEMYLSMPELHGARPSRVLPLLLSAVRGEMAGQVTSPTPTVDPKKKEAASTSSGKSPQNKMTQDAKYFSKLSPAEIEKEIGFGET